MTIEKNIWADVQDGVTQGLAAAELVNDNKRAVNEVIDVVNPLVDQVDLIQNTVDGLGTASTKNVATEAEAIAGEAGVLPDAAGVRAFVSQYGVGVTSAVIPSDIDDFSIPSGFYVWNTSASGTPPQSNSAWFYYHTRGIAAASQLAFRAEGDPRVFFRRFLSNSWSPWRELYHTGNIVGTVSQSSGVPTGAIIQRGSNANGEFVRYADGTQICTQIFTFATTNLVLDGGLYRQPLSSNIPNLPTNFINTDYSVSTSVYTLTDSRPWVSIGGTKTVSKCFTEFTLWQSTNVTRTFTFSVTTIGRWY